MFCCRLSSKKSSNIKKQNEREQPFINTAPTISYRTVSPYAHAIKDDIIEVELSNVVDTNSTEVSLFNGTMPDRTTQSLSFNNEANNSVVSAITNNDDHCLFDRFLSVNHVSTANSVTNTAMCSSKSSKPNSSNVGPMARPFDEFSYDITSTNTLDGQCFNATTSNKD